MARRTVNVTIHQPAVPTVDDQITGAQKSGRPAGRDHGKMFLLTEMSAAKAEEWALRALLALTNAGAEIPDDSAGIAGLAAAGFEALNKLTFAQVKPLLDEMFTCVQYVHKAGHPPQDADENIEEVTTRLQLRKAVFQLHTGFLETGATLILG